MPHSTIAYPFEERLFHFAFEHSNSIVGETKCFFVVVDDRGNILPARFRQPDDAERWHSNREALLSGDRMLRRYLYYDPFDWPEYAWIEWHGIDQFTMQRLTGLSFEDADFVSTSGERITFPETWSCMC